jgi:hypothetical protein
VFTIRIRYLSASLGAVLGAQSAAQTIETSPHVHVFSAIARGSNPPSQTGTISNASSGSLTWQLMGKQAAWLSVGPGQGTAPSSLTFSVNIAGMRAGIYYDKVRVASNDPTTPTDTIPVVLRITDPVDPPRRLAVYEVEFSMTGYVGELNGAPQCKVRRNGTDRMVGTLMTVETAEPDEDVVYSGILRRETDIDYCLTKGRKRPGDDERVWCELTLKGWSVENVEMTVHSDSARGGYLKSKTEPGYSSAGIPRSTCDKQETWDAANGYANSDDGGGGSPNGQQIDDVMATDPNGRPIWFVSGGVPRLRIGTFPPATGTGWTLRVIRKVQ